MNRPRPCVGGCWPRSRCCSSHGSLYARDPLTGAAAWIRVVRPSPVTPSFAGFGLFNGAVGFANDRFFAALYDFTPPIVGPPKHLQAFSAVDGSMAWEDEIGRSSLQNQGRDVGARLGSSGD